jgi:cysteinyl-tRNA synthetase
MNITDIDDKIIKKAREENKHFLDVTKHFEADFFEDMKTLNVEMPDVVTRVSEYMPEIIDYIKTIE